MCEQFDVSDRTGAAIASAVLKDFVVIGDHNLAEIIESTSGILNWGPLALLGSYETLSRGPQTQNLLTFFIYLFTFFLFSCIFILLSRESDQCAIASSLRSCRPSVYHTKMGESR